MALNTLYIATSLLVIAIIDSAYVLVLLIILTLKY